ncbi:MAG: DUF3078 domain-containing protein [Puia sp.]|nr:DUF3078 domain-containing protein [Puia sp.]
MRNLIARKNLLRKLYLSLSAVLLISHGAHAQDKDMQTLKSETSRSITHDPNDTIPRDWKTGGLYNLTFNQAALSNWAAGGDKSSLSLNTMLNLYAFYLKGKHSWDNSLNLAYGMVNTTSLGMRKSDDQIDFVSKYGYDLGKKWYLSTLLNFRTQFAPGYAYPDNNTRILTSNFLAPAYLVLSEGIDYKPNDNFSFFLSPASARWIIVNNDSLANAAAYGVDSGKHSRFQFGSYASIGYTANLSKTAIYKGRLDLYSDYLHNPQDITLYMTNILAVKVTRIISINFSLTIIYDNDIKSVKSDGGQGGPLPQVQEVLGIGMAYKFDNSGRAKRRMAMGKTGG